MTYRAAEDIATHYAGIIGQPMLRTLVFLDNRKITSLLVCSPGRIKEVYSAWWYNGNDNQKAVTKNKAETNFEVFLMSYEPSIEEVIYYLRLATYLGLRKD